MSLKRVHGVIVAATVLSAALLAAPLAWAADNGTAAAPTTTTTVAKPASSALDQKVAAISLPGVPLSEAIMILQSQAKGLKVAVDPQVKADAPVTVDMKDTTVRAVLDSMVKQANMAYTVKPDGSVFISSPENIKKMSPAPATPAPMPAK